MHAHESEADAAPSFLPLPPAAQRFGTRCRWHARCDIFHILCLNACRRCSKSERRCQTVLCCAQCRRCWSAWAALPMSGGKRCQRRRQSGAGGSTYGEVFALMAPPFHPNRPTFHSLRQNLVLPLQVPHVSQPHWKKAQVVGGWVGVRVEVGERCAARCSAWRVFQICWHLLHQLLTCPSHLHLQSRSCAAHGCCTAAAA